MKRSPKSAAGRSLSDMNPEIVRPNLVGLGEVLWDVFPDAAHFGGAPANFACHAAGLGGDAWVVSAV